MAKPEYPTPMPGADKAHALRAPMAGPAPPRPKRSIPVFTPYVVIWTMFGALSVGYMGIAGLAPDWLDDVSLTSSAIRQRADDLLAGEIGKLQTSVAQLQTDVGRVRSEVELSTARQATAENQIAALEQRLSATAQTSAPALPGASPPPQSPKLINAERPPQLAGELETGSVAKSEVEAAPEAPPAPAQPAQQKTATADFGPAIVKPAPKPMGLQISSGPTIEGLLVSWMLLSENYAGDLKKLKPRYTVGGDAANPTYDLIAGPLKKAEAVKACKALVAKSVPCTVAEYAGNAL